MKIYVYTIRNPLPPSLEALATPKRRARAQRYLTDDDRARCLAAGVLLAVALKVYRDEDIELGRNGKPALKRESCQFSIAHSGDYTVLGVADGVIGIDIERVQPYDRAIAEICLTENERGWLREQASDEAFYRIWTGKEAIMKATGEGLALEHLSICVLPVKNGLHHTVAGSWH